jgi:hypothetical protein
MSDEPTPPELHERVRSGILTALKRDMELRGARTARLLLAAGAIGVVGTIGLTLLLAVHPFGHHPAWHLVVLPPVWAGLLVVCLALAFLQVRTPSLPLARSASVAVLGLGLAGICGSACPDPHFLQWWSSTEIGSWLIETGGRGLSALCFGLVTSLVFGAVSAALAASGRGSLLRPLLPAAMLLVLLSPGVALQSVDTSWGVSAAWLLGTAVGCYGGVASGVRLRRFVG